MRDGRGGVTLPFAVVRGDGPAAGAGAGEGVLMFRPEDVAIAREGAPHFSVKVEEAVYLGSRIRLGARTECGQRILLDVDNVVRVDVGDRLPVRLDVAKTHVLDKEDP